MKIPDFLAKGINEVLKIEPNGSNEEAVETTSELISKAEYRVHIVAGELDEFFYTSDSILNSIKEITNGNEHKDKNVDVTIIHSPNANPKSLQLLKEIKGIKIIRAKKRPSAHFMVVDNNVRIEDYHPPGKECGRAYIVRDTSYLAEKMEREYQRLVASSFKKGREKK